tara:strand:- start:121 stop:621 length:501 start_codon:yes stop_codon:yes gene_type:complete
MSQFPNSPEDVAGGMDIFNINRFGEVRSSVDLPFEIGEALEQAFGGDDTIAVLFSEFGRLVKVRKHFGKRNRTTWRGDIYLIILEVDNNEILDIYNGWNPLKGINPGELTMPTMSYRDIFKRGTFKTLENQGQNIGLFQGNHQAVIEFVKSLLSKANLEWAERNNR